MTPALLLCVYVTRRATLDRPLPAPPPAVVVAQAQPHPRRRPTWAQINRCRQEMQNDELHAFGVQGPPLPPLPPGQKPLAKGDCPPPGESREAGRFTGFNDEDEE